MAHATTSAQPQGATGLLLLADGTTIWGRGFGAAGAKPDAAGGCPNRWQLQSMLGSGGRKMSGREE